MSENPQINIKNTAKIARKNITGLIFSNFFGYLIWSVLYAAILYAAAWWAIGQGYQALWVNLGAVGLYLCILALTFLLRVRAVYNGFKGVALDTAEEVLSSSDHKAAKVGARGFRLIRWFVG